jgi:hypothetical protein
MPLNVLLVTPDSRFADQVRDALPPLLNERPYLARLVPAVGSPENTLLPVVDELARFSLVLLDGRNCLDFPLGKCQKIKLHLLDVSSEQSPNIQILSTSGNLDAFLFGIIRVYFGDHLRTAAPIPASPTLPSLVSSSQKSPLSSAVASSTKSPPLPVLSTKIIPTPTHVKSAPMVSTPLPLLSTSVSKLSL